MVGLHTLSDVVGVAPLPNVAVIMAGGRGTRLGDADPGHPEAADDGGGPLDPRVDHPRLVGDGIREIYVSVNYLAEQIEEHLGDGRASAARVPTCARTRPPLGTAGSLTLLREQRPDLRHPLLVMNGDLMVEFDATAFLEAHRRTGPRSPWRRAPTSTRCPSVSSRASGGRVTGVSEKPTLSFDINAAVYAVEPRALAWLPRGERARCRAWSRRASSADERSPHGRSSRDWIDVGTPTDLARAKGQA